MSFTPLDVYNFTIAENIKNLQLALECDDNTTNWYRDQYGHTAIYSASATNSIECLKVLIERGANVNCRDNDGQTPLHGAAQNGHLESVSILLDNKCDFTIQNNDGYTALFRAYSEGHLEVMIKILDKGADINTKHSYGLTVLHKACFDGRLKCVKMLLSRGADINSKNKNGFTPLHFAANANADNTECIKILLDSGADIDSMNNEENTPLHLAVERGTRKTVHKTVRLLLDNGAKSNIQNKYGDTSIHGAAATGIIELVEMLLDIGTNINIKNNKGFTALHRASFNSYYHCVRFLLQKGIDIDEDINTYKPDEDYTSNIVDCRPMILAEINNRRKRTAFDSFINHHIEYMPYKNNIYSLCYPTGDVRVVLPVLGWRRAEAVRNQFFFKEIFFYLHLHVAMVYTKSLCKTQNEVKKCSSITEFASNNNDTSTLMFILSDRLKLFLLPF